ncbi:hypothetical protein LCGC14_2539640 [marine sediment metagenome]|uniref:Uncharacterized protein n=1 Tax=marine sediment metagenome TaxID=412755 RepID=A0A0F9BDW0_9ZZZZ
MEITPESPREIIKGINNCFFELEEMCHHIVSEFEKCPKVECHLYRPLSPIQNRK